MRKIVGFGLIILIGLLAWSGYQSSANKSAYTGETTVVKVGDEKVSVSEAMIHLLLMRSQIESKWGTKMWTAHTGSDSEGKQITYEQSVKKDVLDEICAEKTLFLFANEKGYKLSEEEEAECMSQAKQEIRGFDSAELISYGITTEKLAQHYEQVAMGTKIYEDVVGDFKAVYDENQFKVATVEAFLFPTVEKLSDGTYGDLDEATCKKIKKQAKKARKELERGASIKEITKKYQVSFGKDYGVLANSVDENVWDSLRSLKKGEASPIYEIDRGYVFAVMDNPDDKARSTEAIAKEVERQRYDAFERMYKEKYQDEYDIDLEEAIWDQLPLAAGDE
ncbi:MAG: hypothetical protein MJ087_04880 [Lachnospiraceae bacterium]|nr:hypothetical protein [Lachnospiraceae bacterium]